MGERMSHTHRVYKLCIRDTQLLVVEQQDTSV